MAPAKIQPTLLGQVAACDREERCKSRFGGKHVIARRMELLFCYIVAN